MVVLRVDWEEGKRVVMWLSRMEDAKMKWNAYSGMGKS
jgi:hypothetical protein